MSENENPLDEIKEMLATLIFLNMRIYDILTLSIDSDEAMRIIEMHQNGQFLNEPPWHNIE